MKKLYAYDFDKTLIPYDSFRRYLWHLIKLRPVTVGGLLLLRKFRMISSARLKEYVTRIVYRSTLLTKDARRFANRIIYDVQWPHMDSKNGIVLIITASPNVYMHFIGEILQCELLCSDYMEKQYVEMYGERKKDALAERYPKAKYEWVYAVSDSESDMCWMKEFAKFEFKNEGMKE